MNEGKKGRNQKKNIHKIKNWKIICINPAAIKICIIKKSNFKTLRQCTSLNVIKELIKVTVQVSVFHQATLDNR